LQLCLWRVFAIGNEAHLRELKRLIISGLSKNQIVDIEEARSIMESWVTGGKMSHLSMWVYSSFKTEKAKFKEMITKFLAFSQALASQLQQYKGNAISFNDIYYHILPSYEIPAVRRGGLIGWLICSDFSEYGVCSVPEVGDLATHMKLSKSSGPLKAMSQVRKWTEGEGGYVSDENALMRVMEVFDAPPDGMVEFKKLLRECETAQGRKLNVIDLEHGLCKIGRML